MNALFDQIRNIFGAIPLSRKLIMVVVLLLVSFGFVGLYMYGQQTAYQPLYGTLSTEDAATIADELRTRNLPFLIDGGVSLILVPSDQV